MRPLLSVPLLALLLPTLAAVPAGAANDQDPRIVELTTVYTCDSDLGGGDTEVTVRTALPRTVTAGTKMAGRPMDFTIVVPEELTDAMREYGIEEVSGRSDDTTYRVGPKTRKVRKVVLPPTEVPAEGLLILEGQGTAQAVKLRKVDTYPVKLPAAFTADVTATGQFTVTQELSCVLADGARSKIGTVRVVP